MPGSIEVYSSTRQRRRRARAQRRAAPDARRCRACRQARTRFAGTRSPATGTSSPACSRSACGRARRRRPRPSARRGRRGPSTSCAGSTSSRSRSSSAGSVSGSSCCAARCPPRAEKRFLLVTGVGVDGGAQRRHRRVRPSCRGRAAASVRPSALRRPVADRDGRVSGRVHRDDARVRARGGAPLPRVADRPARVLLWPAFLARPRASHPGSRCRATRPPTPARPGSPSSPTGRICPRPASGSAGSCSSRFVVWPLMPEARRAALLAVLAPCDRLRRRPAPCRRST